MLWPIIGGFIFFALGLFFFLKPDFIWMLTESWKSYRANAASDLYIKITKAEGIIIMFFSLVMIIFPIAAEYMDSHSDSSQSSTEQIYSDTYTENTSFILSAGQTLETRIKTPDLYERVTDEPDSFASFIRNYPLKENGSSVLTYNGEKKGNQNAHIVIFSLPLEEVDLQQCADSIMRMYAEYFWETKQYDKISFHFTNGFEASYVKWREGYRISVDENDVVWTKSAEYDDSYETFVQYLHIVFTYAGTLSMESLESTSISMNDAEIGDVFLKGASPGHVVMIVDMCENADGEKAFLLAQGYMPAQEFHILKNPAHEDDPWYYEEEINYPFKTPEYTFNEECLRRLDYLEN